jgi:hypothetical protein
MHRLTSHSQGVDVVADSIKSGPCRGLHDRRPVMKLSTMAYRTSRIPGPSVGWFQSCYSYQEEWSLGKARNEVVSLKGTLSP